LRTFSITILGCRVNHYESEQIAQVLRSRGLTQVDAPAGDVRVIHTCSVTSQAAKGSRQAVRKATRLKVLQPVNAGPDLQDLIDTSTDTDTNAKVIVTGCWATSDRAAAEQMPGVDAVITHHEDVNERLTGLLDEWLSDPLSLRGKDGERALADAEVLSAQSGPLTLTLARRERGLATLPLLHEHQATHQRAFLKIQDGCDAHCTYCIIPQLRPLLWSKTPEDAVAEAQALVDTGHKEIVLTGIFLGAFGQPTALRRRQERSTSKPISELIEALCTRVRGLSRLRLSSLEPGDLDEHLIRSIRKHAQLVPHFHLPLQAGSDAVLRKMNRQYDRTQFLEMAHMVHESFDRPAITTDIIGGFPGETDDDFAQTLDVVDRVRFIHTHAFPYSARPNTAAARWTKQFVNSKVANERIKILHDRAAAHSFEFRKQFVGESVTILVERNSDAASTTRHGRCERYFDVHFESPDVRTGDEVAVRIDSVTPTRTHGSVLR